MFKGKTPIVIALALGTLRRRTITFFRGSVESHVTGDVAGRHGSEATAQNP